MAKTTELSFLKSCGYKSFTISHIMQTGLCKFAYIYYTYTYICVYIYRLFILFISLQGVENIRVNVIGRVVHVSHFAEMVSPTTLMTTLNKRHLGVSIVDTGSEAESETGIF